MLYLCDNRKFTYFPDASCITYADELPCIYTEYGMGDWRKMVSSRYLRIADPFCYIMENLPGFDYVLDSIENKRWPVNQLEDLLQEVAVSNIHIFPYAYEYSHYIFTCISEPTYNNTSAILVRSILLTQSNCCLQVAFYVMVHIFLADDTLREMYEVQLQAANDMAEKAASKSAGLGPGGSRRPGDLDSTVPNFEEILLCEDLVRQLPNMADLGKLLASAIASTNPFTEETWKAVCKGMDEDWVHNNIGAGWKALFEPQYWWKAVSFDYARHNAQAYVPLADANWQALDLVALYDTLKGPKKPKFLPFILRPASCPAAVRILFHNKQSSVLPQKLPPSEEYSQSGLRRRFGPPFSSMDMVIHTFQDAGGPIAKLPERAYQLAIIEAPKSFKNFTAVLDSVKAATPIKHAMVIACIVEGKDQVEEATAALRNLRVPGVHQVVPLADLDYYYSPLTEPVMGPGATRGTKGALGRTVLCYIYAKTWGSEVTNLVTANDVMKFSTAEATGDLKLRFDQFIRVAGHSFHPNVVIGPRVQGGSLERIPLLDLSDEPPAALTARELPMPLLQRLLLLYSGAGKPVIHFFAKTAAVVKAATHDLILPDDLAVASRLTERNDIWCWPMLGRSMTIVDKNGRTMARNKYHLSKTKSFITLWEAGYLDSTCAARFHMFTVRAPEGSDTGRDSTVAAAGSGTATGSAGPPAGPSGSGPSGGDAAPEAGSAGLRALGSAEGVGSGGAQEEVLQQPSDSEDSDDSDYHGGGGGNGGSTTESDSDDDEPGGDGVAVATAAAAAGAPADTPAAGAAASRKRRREGEEVEEEEEEEEDKRDEEPVTGDKGDGGGDDPPPGAAGSAPTGTARDAAQPKPPPVTTATDPPGAGSAPATAGAPAATPAPVAHVATGSKRPRDDIVEAIGIGAECATPPPPADRSAVGDTALDELLRGERSYPQAKWEFDGKYVRKDGQIVATQPAFPEKFDTDPDHRYLAAVEWRQRFDNAHHLDITYLNALGKPLPFEYIGRLRCHVPPDILYPPGSDAWPGAGPPNPRRLSDLSPSELRRMRDTAAARPAPPGGATKDSNTTPQRPPSARLLARALNTPPAHPGSAAGGSNTPSEQRTPEATVATRY